MYIYIYICIYVYIYICIYIYIYMYTYLRVTCFFPPRQGKPFFLHGNGKNMKTLFSCGMLGEGCSQNVSHIEIELTRTLHTVDMY